MSNSDKSPVDLDHLHPLVRKAVVDIQRQLDDEHLPFRPFEGFRTPGRQQALFNQNRPGKIITKARPWQSYHQYGLAVDFVLFVDRKWSWSTSGQYAHAWDRLHQIGRRYGLAPLSWEKPHLQLAGVELADLRAGRYPEGGDDSWARNLEQAIESWRGSPAAPPPPKGDFTRPPLEGDHEMPEESHDDGLASDAAKSDAEHADFERAQTFVKDYEGGFSDDPKDPGGATNWGITLRTLKAFRHAPVSVSDVRDLTYEEAKRIYFANYWTPLKCGTMPGPLALAVYNIGVHCGVGGSSEFLQRVLNARGATLKVDGDIGPNTLRALVLDNDYPAVAKGMIDLYEARLRAHPHFEHFRRGFLRRVDGLRQTVGEWFAELRDKPKTPDFPERVPMSSTVDPAQVEAALLEVLKIVRAVHAARTNGSSAPDQTKSVLDLLEKIVKGQGAGAGIGPVNGALGTTIGNLLNGRKSAIGIIGSVLTSLLSSAPDGSPLAGLVKFAPALLGSGTPLLPLFLGIAAWGVLGKMEKWTASQPRAN